MSRKIKSRVTKKDGIPVFPAEPKGLAEIFADFDQAGFPKDFLTSADRDQQPSQEREALWGDFEASRQSPHATDEET